MLLGQSLRHVWPMIDAFPNQPAFVPPAIQHIQSFRSSFIWPSYSRSEDKDSRLTMPRDPTIKAETFFPTTKINKICHPLKLKLQPLAQWAVSESDPERLSMTQLEIANDFKDCVWLRDCMGMSPTLQYANVGLIVGNPLILCGEFEAY